MEMEWMEQNTRGVYQFSEMKSLLLVRLLPRTNLGDQIIFPSDLKLTKKPRAPIVCFVFTLKIQSSHFQRVAEETTSSQDTDCGEESETL